MPWRTVQAAVESAFVLECPVVFHHNLANACMLMQLAAAACGLGSQWVSINEVHEQVDREVLGIPDIFRLEVMIPIGYPAFDPGPVIEESSARSCTTTITTCQNTGRTNRSSNGSSSSGSG